MKLSITLLLLPAAAIASASVFEAHYPGFSGGSVGFNNAGGRILAISSKYSDTAQEWTFEARLGFAPGSTRKTDAFTLAINDGPNPNGLPGQLGYFYFDGRSSSSPALTAYVYNGRDTDSSYRDANGDGVTDGGDFIASSQVTPNFIRDIFVRDEGNERVMGFKVNVAGVNAHLPAFPNPAGYKETKMGNLFGIWFHPRSGSSFTYGSDGKISSFGSQFMGWCDGANIQTVVTPEPASLAALVLGGLVILRRKLR